MVIRSATMSLRLSRSLGKYKELNESCDEDSDADWEISEKQIGEQREIVYRGPPVNGVRIPPVMVLSESAGWVIPIFKELVMDQREIINTEHDYISTKALKVLFMIPVVVLVIVGVSIWKPSYASLGLGLWFYIIYYLCSVTYLCWLRKQEQALEKYRVEIAEVVLKQRKRLRMVEVGDVEADKSADRLINFYCYRATIPLPSIMNTWICWGGLGGSLGILSCGKFYWSTHNFFIVAVAVNVIGWICLAGISYYSRKLPVEECPPV